MNELKDIAIIYKLNVSFNKLEYIPCKVISGIYDEVNEELIDGTGTPYRHIIEGENYGFAARKNLREYLKESPLLPLPILKAKILNSAKKIKYELNSIIVEEEVIPLINIYMKTGYSNESILLDRDILAFYITYYPEAFPEIEKEYGIKISISNENDIKVSENIETNQTNKPKDKIEVNVINLYNEITKTVIDQNEPIMKILTAIWKQYNDFSPNKSRNMLINGSTGVGKTEIFRQLVKKINVPCYIANATEYTASGYIGRDITDMLRSLLDITNGDVKRAERGILIIDELDKLAETNKGHSQVNQKDVQESLLKLVEDGKYDLIYSGRKITFDTSKLLIVGMGSFSRIDLTCDKVVGFNQSSKPKLYKDLTTEDFVKNGMIPELIGRFPVVIQMNELNHDSYLRIINSDNSALNMNKVFLEKFGIELTVTPAAMNEIALSADKQGFGARSLDVIIEKALSVASYEIASNPEVYNELIVTEETIKNNKVYTLKKKK